MYYIAIYHTHKVVITLFLLIYLIKMVLLFSGKERIDAFSRMIKIPEIIVSTLFLLTGILLLFEAAEIRPMMIVKIVIIITAIPVAVQAYRIYSKPLAILSFVMLIGSYGLAEMNKYRMVHEADLPIDVITDAASPDYDMTAHGKALYNTQCIVCHGQDGTLQMSGAKNLTTSQMTEEQIIERINIGKMTMPPYGEHFTNQEVQAISEYVLSIRK